MQIHIHTKQALNSNRSSNSSTNTPNRSIDNESANIIEINVDDYSNNNNDELDDVDAALSKLEKSLQEHSVVDTTVQKPLSKQAQTVSASILDLTQSAELAEELFLMKHKYTFKKLKTYFFVLRDTYLSYYKTKTDYKDLKTKPIEKYCLKNCEITPDLNFLTSKFGIYLKIFQSNEIIDLYLRAFNDESYSKWLAAIKLASRNKTINDADAYKFEIDAVLNLIEMQKSKKSSNTTPSKPSSNQILDEIQVQNFMPLNLLKKFKAKQVNILLIIFIHFYLFILN